MSHSDGGCNKRTAQKKLLNLGDRSDPPVPAAASALTRKGVLPFSKQILDVSEKWMTVGMLLTWVVWWDAWVLLGKARRGGNREILGGAGEKQKMKTPTLEHQQMSLYKGKGETFQVVRMRRLILIGLAN